MLLFGNTSNHTLLELDVIRPAVNFAVGENYARQKGISVHEECGLGRAVALGMVFAH